MFSVVVEFVDNRRKRHISVVEIHHVYDFYIVSADVQQRSAGSIDIFTHLVVANRFHMIEVEIGLDSLAVLVAPACLTDLLAQIIEDRSCNCKGYRCRIIVRPPQFRRIDVVYIGLR